MTIKHLNLLLFLSIFFINCTNEIQEVKGLTPWQLVWEENFNGNTLNETYWSKIPRGWSDWDNYMSLSDSCFALRDGKMILRGIKNNFLPQDTARYLTGGIFTKGKKTFEYGKVVICAKLNNAKGAWPAFWMLPSHSKFPEGGEIDIMERLNYESIVYQTIHTYYTIALKKKDNRTYSATNYFNPEDFNTFSVEIHPDKLVFAVNDVDTFTYPKLKTDNERQFPFGKPFYLLLDMQLGGSWVGKVDEADLPVEVEIDWVKFYELKQ